MRLLSSSVVLATFSTVISALAVQRRDSFCTPTPGVCALGVQTDSSGKAVATVYDSGCNSLGSATFPAGGDGIFTGSISSKLNHTVDLWKNDPKGSQTTFQYSGMNFGPGNGRNNWGCSACGQSQCCGYYFVGPNCNSPWDKAQCTTGPITDAAQDADVRYASVFAENAWDAVVNNWIVSPSRGGLTFPEQVSNFFHGPEGLHCDVMADQNGCSQSINCENAANPGGFLVINSLIAVAQLIQNLYDGLGHAESDITTQISAFSSTFAPIKDTQKALKLILDIVGLGFALTASPIWNDALKALPVFAKGNGLGTLKDMVNPLVSNGVTISKDQSTSPESAQNTIELDMGSLVSLWQKALIQLKSDLFSGKSENINNLHTMISDGKMLEPASIVDDGTIKLAVEKAIFAHLIPEAWSLSNEGINPVIVDAQVSCGADAPKSVTGNLNSKKDANDNSACANGKLYYMFSVNDLGQGQGSPFDDPASKFKFSVLPGASQIDGKTWGGLSKDDFIIGSVAGYTANGNKNGWSIADPTNNEILSEIFDNGVRAPGVINIPVCTPTEAQNNFNNVNVKSNKPSPNYPCN